MRQITPIILIGMNRSGTKWVSNILCKHDEIIGVQSERSTGILETNMFGAMQQRFDLSYPDEYVAFLELWAKTDFFRRTRISKEFFYKLAPRPRNFFALFELLMTEYTRQNGKRYWLQKTSPLRAAAALEYFEHARIVIVRRNLFDTLKSTWVLQMRRGDRRLFRSTYSYVRQRKILDEIARTYAVVEIEYDDLKGDPQREVIELFRKLGLKSTNVPVESGFEKNTSFNSERDRERMLSSKERVIVWLVAVIINLIPLSIMTAGATIKARIFGRKLIPLMPGSFGDLTDKLEDGSRG